MTSTASPHKSPDRSPVRGYGPAVGEPPIFVDPRRWGSLIGLAGGMWFIVGYSPALGTTISVLSTVAGAVLVGAVLFAHYIRPVALGQAPRPGAAALWIYGACVVGELLLINLGSRALTAAGHADVYPALVATAVGLHFIPFAWAFRERMFYWLGGIVATLGTTGLVAGITGVALAADTVAVIAGLSMQAIILTYARGRFAPRSSTASAQ